MVCYSCLDTIILLRSAFASNWWAFRSPLACDSAAFLVQGVCTLRAKPLQSLYKLWLAVLQLAKRYLLCHEPFFSSWVELDLLLRSCRLDMLLRGEVRTAFLNEQPVLLRARAWQGAMISEPGSSVRGRVCTRGSHQVPHKWLLLQAGIGDASKFL
jgi:hypothetical protein